ncbi:methyltransferase domain-containing protein [Candidatus Parcubacteria bacterium]|nr:MAG: methyltransferase domain-containing protein [Candidatus Parcubacteria bacterium]
MFAGSALLDAKKILTAAGVQSGDKLADFGAGRAGHMVFPASKIVGDKGFVYAVDIVPEVVEMLESKRRIFNILNMEVVRGDFEMPGGVKIKDNILDFVLLVNNMWSLKNAEAAAGEMKRVLKSDGRVLVADWRRNAQHPAAPPQKMRKDALQAEAIFLKYGLKKIADIPAGFNHWAILLTK